MKRSLWGRRPIPRPISPPETPTVRVIDPVETPKYTTVPDRVIGNDVRGEENVWVRPDRVCRKM